MSNPDTEPGSDNTTDDIPNPETGVGIGADTEPDTFEPEEPE
jgi:hypothetical protein